MLLYCVSYQLESHLEVPVQLSLFDGLQCGISDTYFISLSFLLYNHLL